MPKSTTLSGIKKEIRDSLDGIFITSWEHMLSDFKDSIYVQWRWRDEFEVWDRDSSMTLKTVKLKNIIDDALEDWTHSDPELADALIVFADELDKASKRVRDCSNKIKRHAQT